MCVDFIDLNKAYLKYSYLLLNIDSLVDTTSSYTILNFYDTFSRYNQILTWEGDYLKMTFIMDEWIFGYKVMPFCLKNARATY